MQLTQHCASQAVLPAEADIDHLVPKKSKGSALKHELGLSTYQREFFDVHDPGNLSYACTTCNRSKSTRSPSGPAIDFERERAAQLREKVIMTVERIYTEINQVLSTPQMLLSTPTSRDLYADVAVGIILDLNRAVGGTETTLGYREISVETESYALTVRPSDEALEAEVEAMEEMLYEDRRHGI